MFGSVLFIFLHLARSTLSIGRPMSFFHFVDCVQYFVQVIPWDWSVDQNQDGKKHTWIYFTINQAPYATQSGKRKKEAKECNKMHLTRSDPRVLGVKEEKVVKSVMSLRCLLHWSWCCVKRSCLKSCIRCESVSKTVIFNSISSLLCRHVTTKYTVTHYVLLYTARCIMSFYTTWCVTWCHLNTYYDS